MINGWCGPGVSIVARESFDLLFSTLSTGDFLGMIRAALQQPVAPAALVTQ